MQNNISNQTNKTKGITFATIAYTIWGFSFFFTRIGLQTASPPVLLASRFFIAFLLMNILVLTGRIKISLKGKKIGWLLLLAFIESTLYFLLESNGILYSNVTFAGIMVAFGPVVSLTLAVIFLKEKPTLRQKIFMGLSIIGVIIVAASGHSSGIIKPIAVLFLIGTCFAGGFARIINRKISTQFTPFERTYTTMTMGFLVFTTLSLIQHAGDPQTLLRPFQTPSFLMSAAILGAFCSFGAFLCVNIAVTELTVTQISVFSSLTTVVSILAGTLILKEPLTPVAIAGATLILLGIWNVNREPQPPCIPKIHPQKN